MSEQIRIEFTTESDQYDEYWITDPTFWDIQRDKEVEKEFLIGRTIEAVEEEEWGKILLTLEEKGDLGNDYRKKND